MRAPTKDRILALAQTWGMELEPHELHALQGMQSMDQVDEALKGFAISAFLDRVAQAQEERAIAQESLGINYHGA